MKIEKLRWVFSALSNSAEENNYICQGFYFHKNWIDICEGDVAKDHVVSYLARAARSESRIFKGTGENIVWFSFPDLKFVFAITFNKSPRKITQEKHLQRLDEVFSAAVNGYRVAHNPLTGLLAKDAFFDALSECISDMASLATVNADTQEPSLPRGVAVMALDIDYFKQVNDTWGHYYGDQVLKAFGQRLEEVASGIRKSLGNDAVVHVGHPSGEEFLVVISANATKDKIAEWATLFRIKISDNSLPSDSEWESLTRNSPANISPPPLQERSITTSIGVTWHTSISRSDSRSKFGAELLDRADTALYRAKAAGRNQVIFYDEILTSCGKIIEYDANTGVAALDIGKNVGVAIGQEFKVFSPNFTGNKKFTVNDGRTIRTLGFYPKVESGRLVVFNTQPEISFACISPHDVGDSKFEVGASLEAIPAGSIRHLLPHFSRFFSVPDESSKSDGIQNMQDFLIKSSELKKTPFSIVVRFSREAEYVKKYGSASLNYALAKLYRSAQTTFHAAKFVEVLDKSSVCIVGDDRAYKEKMVLEFSNDMATELSELGILVGVYCKADSEHEAKTYKVHYSYLNAIEFSRIAASEFGREPDSRVRHFGCKTATNILNAHRESRSYKVGYADYENFISLGLRSSGLENIAGLISSSLGKFRASLSHYETAMKLSPEIIIYKSNYCTTALRLDEFELSLNVMNPLSQSEIDGLEEAHPYGYTCYAAALACAGISGSRSFIKERFVRLAPKALALKDALNDSDEKIIKQMMSAL